MELVIKIAPRSVKFSVNNEEVSYDELSGLIQEAVKKEESITLVINQMVAYPFIYEKETFSIFPPTAVNGGRELWTVKYDETGARFSISSSSVVKFLEKAISEAREKGVKFTVVPLIVFLQRETHMTSVRILTLYSENLSNLAKNILKTLEEFSEKSLGKSVLAYLWDGKEEQLFMLRDKELDRDEKEALIKLVGLSFEKSSDIEEKNALVRMMEALKVSETVEEVVRHLSVVFF